jgi:hypothetical protein
MTCKGDDQNVTHLHVFSKLQYKIKIFAVPCLYTYFLGSTLEPVVLKELGSYSLLNEISIISLL